MGSNGAHSDSSTNKFVMDEDGWLLMGSPYPMAAILVTYLSFVLLIGPIWMSLKKPYNLQRVIVAYNAFQVAFNAWMLYSIVYPGVFSYLTKDWCEPIHTTSYTALAATLPHMTWWYFFNKIIDLLDTVFFVLRKKQNQVTFLHVYHHTSMVLFVWALLKYHQGEQGLMVGMTNCFVHIVMYTYYLLAALGPEYQKYLWWKEYMTMIQLLQFCLNEIYLLALLAYDCPLSKSLTYFITVSNTFVLFLFVKFYMSTYKARRGHVQREKNHA